MENWESDPSGEYWLTWPKPSASANAEGRGGSAMLVECPVCGALVDDGSDGKFKHQEWHIKHGDHLR